MNRLPKFFQWCLAPLAVTYGIVIEIRNYLYNRRIFETIRFSVPVISVGNLTVGGTGKTPMVIFLANLIQNQSRSVGIVSRGYGRKSTGTVIVHDGSKICASPQDAGDEPWLMASVLSAVPVIVDEDRCRGIQKQIDDFGVDIVLLDDAYQHRRAGRDVDILLFNANEPIENYQLLPMGRLREPLRETRRAGIIILTKIQDDTSPEIAGIIRKLSSIVQLKTSMNYHIYRWENEKLTLAEIPKNELIFAFSGIGDPSSFQSALEESNIQPVALEAYPDHEKYSPSRVSKLQTRIQNLNCKAVVTTEKDLIKLPKSFLESFSTYIIRMTVAFDGSDLSIIMRLIRYQILKSE
ncbi:MAG: tetraacyldisaccharide 4'-kinase [Fidelibacterota bacterium]